MTSRDPFQPKTFYDSMITRSSSQKMNVASTFLLQLSQQAAVKFFETPTHSLETDLKMTGQVYFLLLPMRNILTMRLSPGVAF